jgi:enoyl-CoA hydratase
VVSALTASAELSLEVSGRTAILTFQSPSLGRGLQEDLWRTMNALNADPDIAVIVFTGRRNVFMTGAELSEVLALQDRHAAMQFLDLPHSIVRQFYESSKILIAAINGYCLGGGLELALTCDLRYAVDQVPGGNGESAGFFGFPEAELGLVPALGGAYFARDVLGTMRAKEMLFSAERINAHRALQIGLVNAIFPREALRDEVLRTAQGLSGHSLCALRSTKRLLHLGREAAPLEEALRETRHAFAECCVAGDKDDRIKRMRAERAGHFRQATAAGAARMG